MSFWSVMNVVAWGLSAVIVFLFITDFIRVEKGRFNDEK
jgi:hypothetical protein